MRQTGRDIIESTFDEIKPNQDMVKPEKVEEYAQKLQNGESVPPIKIYEVQGNVFQWRRSQRFVASQQTGIPVETIIWEGVGSSGLLDWTEVIWKEFINESQFWD